MCKESAGGIRSCSAGESSEAHASCGRCQARAAGANKEMSLAAALGFATRQLEILDSLAAQLREVDPTLQPVPGSTTVPTTTQPDPMTVLSVVPTMRYDGWLLFSRSDRIVDLGADGNKLILPGVTGLIRVIGQLDVARVGSGAMAFWTKELLRWIALDAAQVSQNLSRLRLLKWQAAEAS